MNIFLKLAFLFAAGCIAGWLIEVVFRHFYVHRKYWVNPGFLMGPYLPLYGFGLCTLYLLAQTESWIPIENGAVRKTVLFLVMALCMTAIEYIAGRIFICGMHVRLWDYSNMWGNVQGIICPLFSFLWAVLSAVYYFFLHPHVAAALQWFSANLAFSFFIGVFFGVFTVDCFCSFHIVARVKALAEEYDILVRYEELKTHIRERAKARREKVRFFFPFRSPESLADMFRSYMERHAGDKISIHRKILSGRNKNK